VLHLVALCQIKELHTTASANKSFTFLGISIVLFKDMAQLRYESVTVIFVSAFVTFWDFSNLQQWLVFPALPRYLCLQLHGLNLYGERVKICDAREEKEVVLCVVQ
jgi:hypothetical protein